MKKKRKLLITLRVYEDEVIKAIQEANDLRREEITKKDIKNTVEWITNYLKAWFDDCTELKDDGSDEGH